MNDHHEPQPDPYGPGPTDHTGHGSAGPSHQYGPQQGPGTHGGPQGGPHYGPQQGPQQGPGPSSSDKFFNSIRQVGIVRTEDRWIAGVAGGVARKFGLDPLLVRGLLAASLLLLGTGLVIYGICWALLPEERDGRIHFEEMLRGNFDGALIGAGVAVIAGFGWGGLTIFPFSHFNGWFTGLLWLAALGGLIAVAIVTINKQRATGQFRTSGPTMMPIHTETSPGAHDGAEPPSASAYSSDSAAPYSAPYSSAAHSAQQGTYTHPPVTPPIPPTPPSTPPAPRIPGPGVGLTGSILGIWALCTAALLLADRVGVSGAPSFSSASGSVISFGILIGLAGLGIVIAGLRGRTSGALGTIAIITMVFTIPLAGWLGTDFKLNDAARSGFGEATFRPLTVEDAENGFAMVAGDWVLDLRGLPSGPGPVQIPVTLAAGDLTVQVPPESAWTADVQLAAGQVNVDTPTDSVSRGGVLIRTDNLKSDSVIKGASPEYELSIRGAAGQINIIEERP